MSVPHWAIKPLRKACQKYHIPERLLISQIEHESGFDPRARGENRDAEGNLLSVDRGLAQINSYWHPEVTDEEAYDSKFAINWIAREMSDLYKKYGSWGKALSVYNTGNPEDGFKNGYVKAVMSKL